MGLRQAARPLCVFALLTCVAGAETGKRAVDLSEASLEELMNLEVTSVAKKEQKLSHAAAAIHVITSEDIHRSGFTSIPEALRLVPGVQVARISATEWAITARGFNAKHANKLLVLIDGRSVYTPLYSGVYWDVQDLLLEDVDRIEAIRGPGATMWGANAVNGVINIITKPAKETQGGLLTAEGGNQENARTAFRYGGKLGGKGHYRVSSQYFNRDQLYHQLAEGPEDDWEMVHGASRMDWEFSQRNSLTVQGDVYKGGTTVAENSYFLAPPSLRIINEQTTESGGNILARWWHLSSESSDMSFQLYYDRTRRYNQKRSEYLDAFDADFQHRFARFSRQEFLWGMGWRITADGANDTLERSYEPNARTDQLFSAFVQDEIQIAPGRLALAAGSKFEHNDFTGFEFQPGIRGTWTPHHRHSLWAAVSRALRTPARSDQDQRKTLGVSADSKGAPNLRVRIGDPSVRSEALRAHELGYRFLPSSTVSLDFATFYNVYGHLISYEPEPRFLESTPAPEHLVIPQYYSNRMHAESYGAEIAANWSVAHSWRLGGSYSWLRIELHRDPSSGDTGAEKPEGENPRHQFQLHSHLELTRKLFLHTSLYYVSSLPARQTPAYTRVDARSGWRLTPALELSLVGQNLLDRRHPEFSSASSGQSSEIVRSAYTKLTWRF